MDKKILIIDDDERLVGLYEMTFKGQGYEVSTSLEGEEGLAKIIKEKPDLVLLDVMMPVKSGFDILNTIKNNLDTKQTKVVMLTALSDEAMKIKAFAMGAVDYIVKSQLTIPEVTERINNLFIDNK